MEKEQKIEIGKRIRALRTKQGMTMEEFGELFDPVASKSIVSRWESGKSIPSNERIKTISDNLNVSTLYLLEGKKTISDYETLDDGSVIPGYEWVNSFGNEFYNSALTYSSEFLNNSSSFSEEEAFAISKLYNLIFTLRGIKQDYPENYKETISFIGVLLQNLNYQIEKKPELSLNGFYTEIINKTEYPKNN